jgi:hypothetical protein
MITAYFRIPTRIDWYTSPPDLDLGESEDIIGILYDTRYWWLGGLNGKQITIVFTAPNNTQFPITETTNFYFIFPGVFEHSFRSDIAGTWSIYAQFNGDPTYNASKVSPTAFNVAQTFLPHFVDGMADLHSPTDVGTHSSFPDMQVGPDDTYDTLLESNVGGTSSSITPSGSTPCGSESGYRSSNARDDNTGTYWWHNSNENHYIVFDMGQSYTITQVRIYQSTTQNQRWGNAGTVNIYVSTDGSLWSSAVVTGWTPASGSDWQNSPTFSKVGRYIRLEEVDCTGQSSHRMYEFDAFCAPVNYQLNLKVQFTEVTDYAFYTQLCIQTGNLASENIRVDYWNGVTWVNLRTDLNSNTLNTIAVSLTGPTFEIRFNGGTETSDTTQNSWSIDCCYLNAP